MTASSDTVVTGATDRGAESPRVDGHPEVDPITTEVVRHALSSAAGQMKWVLIRAAFAPNIYEVRDFAVALYDRRVRLLAQAPSMPLFMGTMGFCIEAAVEGVGGEGNLDPGDIVLYNWPYGIGSHAQDSALIMPVFAEAELVGYSVIKAHWPDIGAQAPYCADTTDVFQEGTFFRGNKLYVAGSRNEDVYDILLANSRMPNTLAGDVGAQVAGVRAGSDALARLVERYGRSTFGLCVERMFDHGETLVRRVFEGIPDGRYEAQGMIDDDGLDDTPVYIRVAVEVEGSTVRVDYSASPDATRGPINCPLPTTVSATRLALTLLAGGGNAPNEGMYRAIEVATRPGSLFHPLPPAPCFLYGWPAAHAVDVIYGALAQARPDIVPACSGGDVLGLIWWGVDPSTGEPWYDGPPHPSGLGAHAQGDGAHAQQHYIAGIAQLIPAEVYETRTQLLIVKEELAQDSCGAGRNRGGLGIDKVFESRDDSTYLTAVIEGTKLARWGLAGGRDGQPSTGRLDLPDGASRSIAKSTGLHVPKGARFTLRSGGGGGFGSPTERDSGAVREDVRKGYITEAYAREHFPHAFAAEAAG